MKKVCFICSSGGHYSELKNLFNLSKQYHSFLVTEKTPNFSNMNFEKIYFVKEINRKEKFFIFNFLKLLFKSLWILIIERPKVIITTGALASYPLCYFGHLLHSKVIYIESLARVSSLSKTGEKLYHIADYFFVQWEELHNKYPQTIYAGNVYGEVFE